MAYSTSRLARGTTRAAVLRESGHAGVGQWAVIQTVASSLAARQKKALLEAHRAWIKFRDTNCRFYYNPEGGSSARVAMNAF
jgi:Lysozyme inhibitor LprI